MQHTGSNQIVFVEVQPIAGRVIPVANGTTIGRVECDVVLPDPEVSRKHAVLKGVEEGLGIQDLGSMNGTFVNGRRIDELTALRPGDRLRFGNTIWRVQDTGGETRAAPSVRT